MIWTLAERCCGSAALTFHLLGAKKPILPYQGSKWRYRKDLTALLAELGFEGPPSRVILTDPGPWGRVVRVLLGLPRGSRDDAQRILTHWAERDPRGVYDMLQGASVSGDPAVFTAEFLFLQRLAFSGKAVGVVDGRWASPGFNKTSAYGIPATDRFGAIRPMIPVLVNVLRDYERDLPHLDADDLLTAQGGARSPKDLTPKGRMVEYIDPPYQGSTRYPGGHLDRADVVQLALAAHGRGAAVLVSEAEPIPELTSLGWSAHCLRKGPASGTSPFKASQGEWVTFKGAP